MNSIRKPILISGAGLSALLLAQALLRASIPFCIFERDSSISFRAQGYRLRLSLEGLDAIESVLGPDAFQRFWDTCGKTGGAGFTVLDVNSCSRISEPAKNPKTEESNITKESLASRDGMIVGISRGDMRKIFMSGCEPFIKWSHHITGYELTSSGVCAVFADGSRSVEGEMLIGAEGVYSQVAKQVSKGQLKVYDTGARGIHGQALSPAFKGLEEGVWRLVDSSNPRKRVFVITNIRPGELNDPNSKFGWTMGAQPGVINAPNDNLSVTGTPAASIAKQLTSTWHPRLRPMFEEMIESEAAFWKITTSTPTGVPTWKNEPRVTVIGDAAHAMTPSGGIGANTACQDSALLGSLIVAAGGYKDGITAAYEEKMRIYASEAVGMSYAIARGQFGISIDENSRTI